jgi:hypothetical protein
MTTNPVTYPLSNARITTMTDAARKLLDEVLALPEDDRVKIASEVLASLDGPPDADWDDAWLAELERRERAAKARGAPAPEWSQARARILARLAGG